MTPEKERQCLDEFERRFTNLSDYVTHYASQKGKETAIIEYHTDEKIPWSVFERSVKGLAAQLLNHGYRKGDIIATSLPLVKEHLYLMYAAYRVGVIVAPLDLRLKKDEIVYALQKIRPKGYFFLGETPQADFRPLVKEALQETPFIEHAVQFQNTDEGLIEGALSMKGFTRGIAKNLILSLITGSVKKAREKVSGSDPCLIIFTTGSTGSPKPAMLTHDGITAQNIGLCVAFELQKNDIFLANLPPSHVGCITEQVASTIYGGSVLVILPVFDAAQSLDAIEKYRVTLIGQIPALFNLEWRVPDYDKKDLSSLRLVVYGGQSVTREFLEKMAAMAPDVGTGDGLTEASGFCSYTPMGAGVDEVLQGIGFDQPLCRITIRKPMKPDRTAGDVLPAGDSGEICLEGVQVFPGYYCDPENTRNVLTREGVLYTGDVGSYDDKGLHFSGRRKFIIKPKGYQVFPGTVESHISARLGDRLDKVAVVGVPHDIFSEGIMAFVESDKDLTPEEVMEACQDISAYSRPSHVKIVEPGSLPLTRSAKVDYLLLAEEAVEIAGKLRDEGGWDNIPVGKEL